MCTESESAGPASRISQVSIAYDSEHEEIRVERMKSSDVGPRTLMETILMQVIDETTYLLAPQTVCGRMNQRRATACARVWEKKERSAIEKRQRWK